MQAAWLLLGCVAPCAGLVLHSNSSGRTAGNAAHAGDLLPAVRLGKKYKKGKVDVYYTAEMLDKLREYLEATHKTTEKRYDTELLRLRAAKNRSVNRTETAFLERAIRTNEASRKESEVAAVEGFEFYYTVSAMLGAHARAPTCRFLACGRHAKCKASKGRARCECKPCFEGDGFVCRPRPCDAKTDFAAQPLLGRAPLGYPMVPMQTPQDVKEVHITVFARDHMAVTVRDAAASNQGFLVIGRVAGTEVTWGPWRAFSGGSKAFGPMLEGLPTGRFMIAYRDEDRGGTVHIVGGRLNATDDLRAVLGTPQVLARGIAQRMALVRLSGSRVACLYSDWALNTTKQGAKPFGAAVLVELQAKSSLEVLGRFRFAYGQRVARLAVTALTSSSFVVAYRVVPEPSAPPGEPSGELSAVWMGVQDNELAVDPNVITLEPNRVGMWARDVALVSQNLIAYTYESSSERVTKMATIYVHPGSHKMRVASGPKVLAKGNTAFVQAISLPAGAHPPRTFTFFQHPKQNSQAEVCSVSPEGSIGRCNEVAWADAELRVVSGTRLLDGRLAFAYATKKGAIFWRLLDARESGMQDV